MAYAALDTIQTIATGQVFTAATLQQANDNGEFFIDPPACSVYASSAQSVGSSGGPGTALTANSERYDNDSMHSTVTNTSRITAQTAGRYLFTATVEFAVGTGDRLIRFKHNNTTFYDMVWVRAAATPNTLISATRSIVMAASDYVEVFASQDSGSNKDVTLREFTALYLTR